MLAQRLSFRTLPAFLMMAVVLPLLAGCGYNTIPTAEENAKAAWSEVLNQYQRRSDLIPNIVATVKGEANFEQETLTKVIEARAKATSIQVTPETLNNPEAFNRFQQAQGELSSALSRLMAVSERYPDLKANQSFRELRVQLEGTENHHRRAQSLHPGSAGVQRTVAQLPQQPDGDGLSLRAQAHVHRAERGADLRAAASGLRRQEVSKAW